MSAIEELAFVEKQPDRWTQQYETVAQPMMDGRTPECRAGVEAEMSGERRDCDRRTGGPASCHGRLGLDAGPRNGFPVLLTRFDVARLEGWQHGTLWCSCR